MKAAFTSVLRLALATQLVGCASTRLVQVSGEGARPQGLRIAGYTLADGTLHTFRGVVRPSADGDQLVFRPTILRPTESGPEAEKSFTLPRQDVASLRVEKMDKVRAALLAVGVSGALLFALIATDEDRSLTW